MLNVPVNSVRGIGTVKAAVLEKEAGIRTVEDLLYYTPRRYLDRSRLKRIADCLVGEDVTLAGTIEKTGMIRRKKEILEVIINDGSASITLLFFSGIKFFNRIFSAGESVLVSGRVSYFRGLQMVHPEFDFLDESSIDRALNTGRIIPLYKSTLELKKHGFDSRGFRRSIMNAIDQFREHINEPLSRDILGRNGLINLNDALTSIHFPETFTMAEEARRRLAFNEIFFMQYYLAITRITTRKILSRAARNNDTSLVDRYIAGLSFTLTGDQKNAVSGIIKDLSGPFPMNRLLQGDVGSGKTVVAIATALFCISKGEQVAIMAPTEILASQHYATSQKTLPAGISCRLITGSMTRPEKKIITDLVKEGDCDLLIGTHSLIQDDITFKNLGYIVIDEQHRFGVEQRAALRNKGNNPDLLVMTATPIPRSLALTIYGDMDISGIREKPSGREPVKTFAFPESRLKGVYNSMKKYIEQGRQIYYVLPLIEESEKTDLKSAVETYNYLRTEIFPDRSVEIMHGKLKQKEKDEVMTSFRNAKTDILVTTSVIEVGVDVPNASVIIIHHAERFGLAQLHQLRGRVGRGEHQSFCVLIHPDNISGESLERIRTMTETDDGFIIAEKDLQLRGDGQITGTRQHGRSDFEFMNPATDMELILAARTEAVKVAENTDISPEDMSTEQVISSLPYGIRTVRILSILS